MKNATPMQQHYDTSSVFVAVIGRPNVGKSSLTNLLVGEKVAIVTSKPQTTRTRITGVITRGPLQYVLLDTPGRAQGPQQAGQADGQDGQRFHCRCGCFHDAVSSPYGALNEPEMVLVDALRQSGGPAIAVINKTRSRQGTGGPGSPQGRAEGARRVRRHLYRQRPRR